MKTIRLQTAIPGPQSRKWMERRTQAVPRGPSHHAPIFIDRAEGATLFDIDGNQLLDFAGGIGCLNVGHSSPAVRAAAHQQVDRFTHAMFSVTPYSSYVQVAEELNRRAPGNFQKKTLLINSGAEAVENAIKIARAYTGRSAVIAFEDAFHGRTLLAMSLTSKVSPYKVGFGPFAPDVCRIPFSYCYRCSYSLTYPECEVHCARALEDVFARRVEAETVAAVIVEPVLGEGGFVPARNEFLPIVAEICRRHGILLIADEVQTGFGRTGTFYACEQLGIEPDLIVSGKSLAAGLPLAAVTGRAEIMDAPIPGSLGGTYGGNPVTCEAALAVMNVIDGEDLCARAYHIGSWVEQRTKDWMRRFPLVGDLRGLGAMRAFEFVTTRDGRQPAKEETQSIVRYCYEHGLMVLSAGTYGNVIRLLVPLIISDEQLNEGFEVLEEAIASVCNHKLSTAGVP